MAEDPPRDQPTNFVDEMVSRELRFSIGVETKTGHYYLSIPVANRRVDYEEYYEIDRSAYEPIALTLVPLWTSSNAAGTGSWMSS